MNKADLEKMTKEPCNTEKTTIVTDVGKTFTGHIPHCATCPKYKDFKKEEKEE